MTSKPTETELLPEMALARTIISKVISCAGGWSVAPGYARVAQLEEEIVVLLRAPSLSDAPKCIDCGKRISPHCEDCQPHPLSTPQPTLRRALLNARVVLSMIGGNVKLPKDLKASLDEALEECRVALSSLASTVKLDPK